MTTIVLRRCDVTMQSLRSLESWIDSRGEGEQLSESLEILTDALREQRDITITMGR